MSGVILVNFRLLSSGVRKGGSDNLVKKERIKGASWDAHQSARGARRKHRRGKELARQEPIKEL
jgi:hypothetical protein